MRELVALDVPWNADFVTALQQVWDAGDAAFPLDPRVPRRAAEQQLDALAPAAVVGPDLARVARRGARPVAPGDALVVATSGSTGAPRGVVLTHDAIRASAAATTARLAISPEQATWLACLPLSHIGGLAVVTRALLSSTPLVVLPRFDAALVEALGRRGRATHVSLVPTALRRIDADVFRCILLGGAAPPCNLPAHVVPTYGMTETGSGVVYGGEPLDGVEVAIGDGAPGRGADGEILLRGPMLLRCYRDGADPRIPGPDGRGGWLPTGDAGRLDRCGRLEVHGRLADVVVTGGEKVWPQVVEGALATNDRVADVAVWKRPDPEWGERVVAWVVPRDRFAPPRLAQLREHVAERLPRWAAPRELVLVDALPRTPSGKIRRRALS